MPKHPLTEPGGPAMTAVLALLDDVPPRAERELRRRWDQAVARSLSEQPARWLECVQVPGALDGERGWRLLGWVEDAASLVASTGSAELVASAAFAVALLEASPVDRREVLVDVALVRRACRIAGVDYRAGVGVGCRRAGPLGATMGPWLMQASPELPPTYEQVGAGAEVEFRRRPDGIGLTEEEALAWFGEGQGEAGAARAAGSWRGAAADDPGPHWRGARPEPTAAAGVQPWPAWVRYPLIALLAVVAVAGIVLAARRGVAPALLRLAVAGVLLPAVLLPVQLWGLRRRSRRR